MAFSGRRFAKFLSKAISGRLPHGGKARNRLTYTIIVFIRTSTPAPVHKSSTSIWKQTWLKVHKTPKKGIN